MGDELKVRHSLDKFTYD